MPKMKTVALASLVEDLTMYPRNRVDEVHIADLLRAAQAGAEMPPIVVDAKSLRIVDGVHRCRMLMKHLGDDATAEVEMRAYKTDADLYLDAVRLNAQHGRKLERHDHSRIVLRLRELKVDDTTIAATLHVPEQQVQTLAVRIVYTPAGQAKPAKRGMAFMHGRTMTEQQIKVIDSVRSAEAGRLCIELARLLDANLVDLNDPGIVDRLRMLSRAIDSTLKAIAA